MTDSLGETDEGKVKLRCLGYAIRDDGTLVNLINNAPVTVHLIDHFLCKASYNEAMTTGARLKVAFPSIYKKYGWPLNYQMMRVFTVPMVVSIARDSVKVIHDDSTKDGDGDDGHLFGPILPCFKFENEERRVDSIVEVLTDRDSQGVNRTKKRKKSIVNSTRTRKGKKSRPSESDDDEKYVGLHKTPIERSIRGQKRPVETKEDEEDPYDALSNFPDENESVASSDSAT